jgi:hypothetical protein
MSCDAPSRFSRGFDCRDILLIGHHDNPMGANIGVAALDIRDRHWRALPVLTIIIFPFGCALSYSQDACVAPRRTGAAPVRCRKKKTAPSHMRGRHLLRKPLRLLSAVEFSRKVTRHFHTGLCLSDFGFEPRFHGRLLVVTKICNLNLVTRHETHNEWRMNMA